MTATANLGLPFIEGGQAQKHVTHNEALRILDAAVQIAVLDRTRTAPPASPSDGARHVVAAGATGAWAGRAQAIASWQDGAWAFLPPHPGWCVWSVADDAMLVFDGAGWRHVGLPPLDSIDHLGINTSADAGNRLSVRSGAALFAAMAAADGGSGDVRLQLAKEASANVASVVFSKNGSGRAEFGLVGSDAFKLKVSPDGSAWAEALVIDQVTGNVTLPRGLALTGVSAPAPITAHQNDYAPAGLSAASVLKIASDAARSISGLASGAEGRVVSVINSGSQPITLLNEGMASVAANRFALGADLVLAGRQATILRYDGGMARWQAIAGQPSRAPTVQTFLSGSGTYTTPPGVKWIEVLAVGGGGGSAGSGTSGGSAGSNGADTTFGSSLIIARGGGAPLRRVLQAVARAEVLPSALPQPWSVAVLEMVVVRQIKWVLEVIHLAVRAVVQRYLEEAGLELAQPAVRASEEQTLAVARAGRAEVLEAYLELRAAELDHFER